MIYDHCHVSTGAILNGKVSLGRGSFVGSGSIIKQDIEIGNDCVIGANIFLRQNITSNTVYKK